MCKLALALIGERFMLPAPVHESYDDIRLVTRPRVLNVGLDLFIIAPGDTRLVDVSLKAPRQDFVKPEQRNS